MVNGLTFDIEDWHQIVHWKITGEHVRPSQQVVRDTEFILQLLSDQGVKGTFFVLGNVAETHPGLVREIVHAGHEVGSHGLSHTPVSRQSRVAFTHETRRGKDVLEQLTGAAVLGYRAAEFSITRSSWWALEALAELGFLYDSSVLPGRRHAVTNSPLVPFRVDTKAGPIIEIPLTAVESWGRRWPVGGGGYFRLLPYPLTRKLLHRVNQEGRAAIVYLHPYEFARNWLHTPIVRRSLDAYRVLLRHSIVHNTAKRRIRERFARLLTEFEFGPLESLIEHVGAGKEVLE